jgi:asparagine synthase (glutamine-hydrolysing)
MCGIAGFVGAGDAGDLHRMLGALAHRGPDAFGAWHDAGAGVWLGHRRLAVVDLAGGAQPMWTADGALGIVTNGEIYNHVELRAELEARGHRFATHHADTEVLLHGYREWGEALLERLEGMWAFALLDRPRRRLWLARDRFGKKPLFWTRQGRTFAFASELAALVQHSNVSARLSPAALRKYFAHGYVPAPASLYQGIEKVPAGAHLALDLAGGAPRVATWWEFALAARGAGDPAPLEPLAEELRERLERAVRRRLAADVPVGILLSGGLDSSGVAALAARHTKPGELRTFSIGFDEPSFDESAHAARVAEALGSRHRSVVFRQDAARAALPALAARLDEPLADASLLPASLLCRLARSEVTVALGGDGADELFAGYAPFHALRRAALYARVVPKPLHRALRLLAARLPVSHAYLAGSFRVQRTLAGLSHPARLWNPVWLAPLGPDELAELFGEPVDAEEVFSEAIEAWERCAGESLVDRTRVFFTRLYLGNDILVKMDRASMLHSLEVRSPYLDREVVELASRVPSRLLLHAGRGKRVLRHALAPLLPAPVLRRPKQGFGVPIGRWLAEGWDPFPELAPQRGAAFYARRLAEHRRGDADHRLYLFAQRMLDGWLAAGGGRARPSGVDAFAADAAGGGGERFA